MRYGLLFIASQVLALVVTVAPVERTNEGNISTILVTRDQNQEKTDPISGQAATPGVLQHKKRDQHVKMVLLDDGVEQNYYDTHLNRGLLEKIRKINNDSYQGENNAQEINDWLWGSYEDALRINHEHLGSNYTVKEINDLLTGEVEPVKLENQINCTLFKVSPEVKNLEDSLMWYVERLRSFTLGGFFDFGQFEVLGKELSRQLNEIETTHQQFGMCDDKLKLSVRYARFLFDSMINSVDILHYYLTVQSPGNLFLYVVVDLNVMLLAMRNFYGDPDTKIPRYAERLFQFAERLDGWEKQFTTIGDLPFGKQTLFRRYVASARGSINNLAVGIPESFQGQ
ncbi:hypothetical protein JCM33374_g2306 [Metschnikowia sp. JCM 33374]|nr:hypothetical protein JCM33374_g2306 [Metschnikowia sp. JCM 33374]